MIAKTPVVMSMSVLYWSSVIGFERGRCGGIYILGVGGGGTFFGGSSGGGSYGGSSGGGSRKSSTGFDGGRRVGTGINRKSSTGFERGRRVGAGINRKSSWCWFNYSRPPSYNANYWFRFIYKLNMSLAFNFLYNARIHRSKVFLSRF